jgi:hypothetical protein
MNMSKTSWLKDAQIARLQPFLSKSHGKLRGDHRHVLNFFGNRDGLRWNVVLEAYSLHKTMYNRWKLWSDKGMQRLFLSAGFSGTSAHRTSSRAAFAIWMTWNRSKVAARESLLSCSGERL